MKKSRSLSDTTGDKINLDGIPSFGRYLEDYQKLFNLNLTSLVGKYVLDCASGGASFPAEASRMGLNVIAVDPLFSLSREEIVERTGNDIRHVLERAWESPELLNRERFATFEEGLRYRMAGNQIFLDDLDQGLSDGRYVGGALPSLPFAEGRFDLAILGHLLFCYGDRLSYEFHLSSLHELARVTSGEVLVYPVRGLDIKISPYLEPLRTDLSRQGILTELRKTDYQEVRGWTEMLVLSRA